MQEGIQTFLIYGISIPITLFFFYIIIYGYIPIFVNRLTKASFLMEFGHLFDLFIAYSLGLIAYLIILNPFIFEANDQLSIHYPLNIFSKNMIILAGIIIIYAGRVVTHEEGIFYARLYLNALFLLSSLVLLVQFFLGIADFDYNFSVQNLIDNTNFFLFDILSILSKFALIFSFFSLQIFIGTIILSTFGEAALCIIGNKPRSLVTILEKLPSNFILIDSIDNKLREMFNEEDDILMGLRCITKSCTLSSSISKYIDHEYDKINTKYAKNAITPNYLIIRTPPHEVIQYYRCSNQNMRIKTYLRLANQTYDLKKNGKIDLIESKFSDFRLLILEYENNKKKMLIITSDKSPHNNRVGLYTEEPYIINIFSQIFNITWQNSAKI